MAVPKVFVEDFGSCSKVDDVGTLVPQKTKKVTFSTSVTDAPKKSPKRPVSKENVHPDGETSADEAPAPIPKKVFRTTTVIDADEENRKMEEQCKQQ